MKAMLSRVFKIKIFLTLFLLGLSAGLTQVKTDFISDLDHALKIINFLDYVARIREETGRSQGKIAEFEENEVSAFFQYLFTEQVPTVKALELKLFPKEKIEGHLLLNLNGYNLPSYFKDELNLYFSARAKCLNRKIRLVFNSLYLETQRIEPKIIDYLIDLIASSLKIEAHHLEDWYDLPSGVEKISISQGKLRIYY